MASQLLRDLCEEMSKEIKSLLGDDWTVHFLKAPERDQSPFPRHLITIVKSKWVIMVVDFDKEHLELDTISGVIRYIDYCDPKCCSEEIIRYTKDEWEQFLKANRKQPIIIVKPKP